MSGNKLKWEIERDTDIAFVEFGQYAVHRKPNTDKWEVNFDYAEDGYSEICDGEREARRAAQTDWSYRIAGIVEKAVSEEREATAKEYRDLPLQVDLIIEDRVLAALEEAVRVVSSKAFDCGVAHLAGEFTNAILAITNRSPDKAEV